ncbi:MAG: hypothetical protein ACTSRA_19790 [Promethearchaeota archaeon]
MAAGTVIRRVKGNERYIRSLYLYIDDLINAGIVRVKGNERYIRSLYRSRWSIEIAFHEMDRLGITTHYHHRDGRLAVMGAKIPVYNMWQVQRYLLRRFDPSSRPLELVAFLGRTCWQRDLIITNLNLNPHAFLIFPSLSCGIL